jgi:uncharacterized membrane protein
MNTVIKKVLGYFLRGLLFVSPIFITAYTVYAIVRFFDSLIPGLYPGVSIVLVLVGITFIGVYSYSILFQWFLHILETVIMRTPGLKFIYSGIKDFLSALVGSKKTFNQPVMVLLMKEAGVCKIGFITKTDLSEIGINNLVAVYFPHSYAFTGNLYLVPRENVTILKDFPPADAMKFVVSGGVTDLISKDDGGKKNQ